MIFENIYIFEYLISRSYINRKRLLRKQYMISLKVPFKIIHRNVIHSKIEFEIELEIICF